MTDSPSADFIITVKAVIPGVDAAGHAEVVEGGGILVRGGTIAEVGDAATLKAAHSALPIIGDDHTVAIPGLVNAHHHFGLTPLMMGVPFAPLELWLPQFRGMRQVGHRLDTLYSAIEMLESGTTTVQHIQGGVSGPEENWHATVDQVAEAYREIGMRVSWSFMIRDQNQITYDDDGDFLQSLPAEVADHFRPQIEAALAPIERHMAFFEEASERWRARGSDRVCLQLAPANLHWCSDPALEAIFETARRTKAKVHMHLVETQRQAAYARKRTGRTAVGHLAHLGCLSPDVTFGHGNWMTGEDLDQLAECGCQICHNASSGLRLGSGLAPLNEMRKRGLKVALGIDQSNVDDDRDMFTEMRLAWALHQPAGMFTDKPSPAEIFRMASEHGAASTGFSGRVGRLDPGMAADIVLVDWNEVARPFVEPRTPLLDALVLRSRKGMVRTVFVGGRKVVEDGRVTAIDRDAVMGEIAARLAQPPTNQEAKAQAMVDVLMPHLEAWFRERCNDSPAGPYRYNLFCDDGGARG